MDKVQYFDLDKIGNSSLGFITVAEGLKNVPFDVKRVYWTYYTPQDVMRGGHAHKNLKQIIFAVSGTIEFNIEDKNGNKETFILDNPSRGIYIPKLIWRDIKFSHSAVLLCLASELYDENDYFRSYEEFTSYPSPSEVLHLVDYTEEILDKSWNWLNDPEIKKLTNTPDFTREDQKIWFSKLEDMKNYDIKGIAFGEQIIGVAGLKKIDLNNKDAEYFGYIGEKQFWGKGLSKQILSEILRSAKEEHKLESIYLNVIPDNIRAIKAYENFGFRIELIVKDNVKMSLKL
ncbi:GNAT family N-acetyltransferase [Chryseobacterium paludis]|uniref:GNAT family N-acetyltransferase n=1 Tax=Chryseobacterium paludis TaxID=2956784 RepID=UPI0021C0FBF7|nr:GNAT family N-acetyltransferase [Chryseobacterium paludis]